ncbi:hypothetical protein NDR89_19715 [Cupriavidus gilardii]|uniref:Lipoprotein n=1 Tax=Cupriavidus gilardii TaxID=82541 RepID=A0ABY4VP85_9BURK|nr:hypothetical protein [Cupriavidus gilardii]USE78866.1 hypothetical protein NDR89_19715 [Cupriavidus gilardii]
MRVSPLIGLVCVAVLSGCAQIRAAERQKAAEEKAASCKARKSELDASQTKETEAFFAGKTIAEKLPVLGKKVTYEMLRNASMPTPEEAADLIAYKALRAQQDLTAAGWWSDCAPRNVYSARLEGRKAMLDVIQDLAMGRITYGQAVEKGDAMNQSYLAKLPTLIHEAQRQEAAAIAEEERQHEVRSQAAAAAFAAGMATAPRPVYIAPPAVPAYRPPTQTNCMRVGNQVNCTTY